MRVTTVVLAVLACSSITSTLSQAVEYSFTKIADDSGFLDTFPNLPSVNDNSVVSFRAGLDDGREGIFIGSGGPLRDLVLANTSPPSEYQRFGLTNPINDDDAVATYFQGEDGTPLTEGILWTAPFTEDFNQQRLLSIHNSQLSGFSLFTDISESNIAAFVADRIDFARALYIVDFSVGEADLSPIELVDTSGPIQFFHEDVSVNRRGLVTFAANLDNGENALYFASTSGVSQRVTTEEEFSQFFAPDINREGMGAVQAQLDEGGEVLLMTRESGPVVTLVDTDGAYADLSNPAINNSRAIAFDAFLDGGPRGIFTGADPVASQVIHTGHELFGSTVTDLATHRGLNNRGEIAFFYELANGEIGVALATPQTAGRIGPIDPQDAFVIEDLHAPLLGDICEMIDCPVPAPDPQPSGISMFISFVANQVQAPLEEFQGDAPCFFPEGSWQLAIEQGEQSVPLPLKEFVEEPIELDGSGIVGDAPGEGVNLFFPVEDALWSELIEERTFFDLIISRGEDVPASARSYLVGPLGQGRAIPEPKCLMLLAIAAVALMSRRLSGHRNAWRK